MNEFQIEELSEKFEVSLRALVETHSRELLEAGMTKEQVISELREGVPETLWHIADFIVKGLCK